MTFLELLRKLEAQLGYHQVPLNPGAKTLKDLFESSPLHHEFTKRLAQSIYSGNRCRRLNDPVERETTFDAVAPLRVEVLRSERTDVDLYRLIEELCVALDRIFGPLDPSPTARPESPAPAQIIELAPFRRRRIKSLA